MNILKISFRIFAHRLVLYAASPYFKALLCGPLANANQEEHTIEEINGKTLEAIVSYCFATPVTSTLTPKMCTTLFPLLR